MSNTVQKISREFKMPNRAQAKPTKSPKMVSAAVLRAIARKARKKIKRILYSHDWAVTMTKWLITRTNSGVKWQIVEFLGPMVENRQASLI